MDFQQSAPGAAGTKRRRQRRIRRDIYRELIAGGVAGAVSRTVTSPLERTKILFQIQSSPGNSNLVNRPAGKRTVWNTLSQMYRQEGILGFFKGNGTNCIRIIPYSAVQFATYEQIKSWFIRNGLVFSTPERLTAGAIAGSVSVLATYPLDIARTRLSILALTQKESSLLSDGMLRTIRNIYVNEGGLMALYRGVSPTILGVAPYVALNFQAYEKLKAWITPIGPLAENGVPLEPTILQKLFIGGLSGMFAQTLTYPLDLVRRRFQVMSMNHYGYKYRTTFGAIKTGFLGLYKGCIPNYLKVIPAIAVSFVSYEYTKQLL